MNKNNSPQKNSSDVTQKGVNFNFMKEQFYDKVSNDGNE